MDTKAVIELVDELEENLEDLEDNLEPVLSGALSATTKKLPLLDRAKLNVLLVYSIESLIFSYLKLHGVQAKEHSVFKELTRVKQYFEKIKRSEATPQNSQPNLSLDKDAAGRFVKHALAGNEKYDLQRAEREAREKVLANRKLKALESAMTAKAEADTTPDADAGATDILAQAAQLASVPLDDPSSFESLADSNSNGEGEGPKLPQSLQPQPQLQQDKKRKNRSRSKSQRAKRKRET
ncbi:uncharacterized protein A1O5_04277 [Cladophialophora psammophila CBS 110553]|uniref:Exosome complex protein n=1 Tax=Cladophialophora psammophila CBS 110553 TaxID=1182543 RepID=W9WYT5_9EURO|nr:uncharacterized protein A1O5_04277 [Cladophialophora psammophila CBS 110553]EXJ73128.1 hypothetical protein A1O5_04277 [Cladophialophora psammophila CBS 110553]